MADNLPHIATYLHAFVTVDGDDADTSMQFWPGADYADGALRTRDDRETGDCDSDAVTVADAHAAVLRARREHDHAANELARAVWRLHRAEEADR